MRSNSLVGLFRRLVVLRWQRLGRSARLAVLTGAFVLGAGALLTSSACLFGSCPLQSSCSHSRSVAPAAVADVVDVDVAVEVADTPAASTACPHSR